jgi:DtxR family Mn-dependent transcriptional regulator
MEALGLSWDQVHEEAERLEHHLSDELESRIDRALGFPTRDPHGDPIPSPELLLQSDEMVCLSDLEAGSMTVVRRVPDGDPELLRYLATLGLVPAEEVTVVDRAPFDGPVTVEVRGARHAIGRSLAAQIEVGVEHAAAG